MGDYSLTCSVSGLGISGGTAVRCLLVTSSPYGEGWMPRTPPLRAEYDSYGSIENIHPDEKLPMASVAEFPLYLRSATFLSNS